MTASENRMSADPGAPVAAWVHGAWPKGVADVARRVAISDTVVRVALMPDVHLASEFCVGMVVASRGYLFPNAVGGDIGCGMLAMRFDDGGRDVNVNAEAAAKVLGGLEELCPGRRHHRRLGHALPDALRDAGLSAAALESMKNGEESRLQLGTLGAGNHFLELQREAGGGETGAWWLMIHTGSRHLGQCILQHHLPRARRLESGVMAIDAESDAGRAYLADVAVARVWARENRRLLALRAATVIRRGLGLTAQLETLYDCDHNHVALETHAGRPVWVHRKGATAARLGDRGIVPGSMGTMSYHTRGKGVEAAVCSSSHGAGRALSRTVARERISRAALRQQLRNVWYDARLEGALREEAPGAYKDIEEVMAAQGELTEIERRLRPVLVYKSG